MKRQHVEENSTVVLSKLTQNEDKTQFKLNALEPQSSGDEKGERSSMLLQSRLGKCEVCAASDARYTCPKCEVKTCSLACVQVHKKELDCDGIRDRTKYIPLKKMTQMDFMSDYYFLEECTRYVEDRKTDRIKEFTRYNKKLPGFLFKLRNAAAERKTRLRFLLQNFSRHKENTTILDFKLRKIFWRVEWVFVNAGNLKYVDRRCDEEIPLYKLLDKYLNPLNVEEEVPRKRELEYYQSIGAFKLQILLKAEGVKRCRSRFYRLDVEQTLKQNLANKTIVECPCIYLLYDSNPEGFDIIDSDEDVEAEAKSYEAELQALQKQQRQDKLISNLPQDEAQTSAANKKHQAQKRLERQRKREEFEKQPNNYLFSDEKLWDLLSSSDDGEGNVTEEEK